jgi:hypothetical protein
MAGFKTQIKAKYKAKFPTVNLTNTRLDSIVDKLDVKIESEDEIETKLDELNEIFPFADIAKQDDKVRDLENKTKSTKTPEQIAAEKAAEEAGKAPEGETATEKLLREILEGQKAQAAEIAAIKGEKTVTSRKQQLADKLKDAPEQFRNDVLTDIEEINFKDDDHFNSYVERKVAAAAGIIQANSDNGLGKDKPASGFGKPAGDKEMSPEMKERIADRKAAAEAKTAQTA